MENFLHELKFRFFQHLPMSTQNILENLTLYIDNLFFSICKIKTKCQCIKMPVPGRFFKNVKLKIM